MIIDEHYMKKAQEEIRRAIRIENILRKKENVINKLAAIITSTEKELIEEHEMDDLTSWDTENEEAIIAYDIGYINACKNAIKIINKEDK